MESRFVTYEDFFSNKVAFGDIGDIGDFEDFEDYSLSLVTCHYSSLVPVTCHLLPVTTRDNP